MCDSFTLVKPVILNDNEKNKVALEGALDRIQSRSRVRTVTVKDVYEAAEHVEKKLGIPKTTLEGVQVHVDLYAQTFPSAYRGIPESTQFDMVFSKRFWRVVKVSREQCKSSGHDYSVTFSDEARKALVERFESFGYC